MNGRKARKLRKQVYGDDMSPKARKYSPAGRRVTFFGSQGDKEYKVVHTGQVVADELRQQYQKLKKSPNPNPNMAV